MKGTLVRRGGGEEGGGWITVKNRESTRGISNPETSLFKVLNLRQKATKKKNGERKKENHANTPGF